MRAARQWGALPFPGAIAEQPWSLVVIGGAMRDYAEAFSHYQADPKGSGSSHDWVRSVMGESVRLRELGEEP